MKKLFTIIAILISTIMISPTFIGNIVESEYESALNRLNDNPAVTINKTTFDRDWFSGKVVTEMKVFIQHEDLSELSIIVEDDISFGPVVFTAEGIKFGLSYSDSTINFSDLYIEKEVEDFIKNKIHLSTLFTFSKDIVIHIAIDEVREEVDGNTVTSAKADGKFTLEDESRLYGEFEWAGLSAITADESFIINDVKFSLDQTLISGNYYQGNTISTGDFNFLISDINAKDSSGNVEFSVSNLLIDATSLVAKDLMEIEMNYSADKLESAGIQLENSNLTVTFNGLDITVMKELNVLLTDLSNENTQVLSSGNLNKLSELTAKLLAHKPVIEIEDFSVVTAGGKIESDMLISADEKQFDTANFMSIMSAINATVNAEAPMEFFTTLGWAPMVELYVEQGFIVQKHEKISVNVIYTQGQLTINGNEFPL